MHKSRMTLFLVIEFCTYTLKQKRSAKHSQHWHLMLYIIFKIDPKHSNYQLKVIILANLIFFSGQSIEIFLFIVNGGQSNSLQNHRDGALHQQLFQIIICLKFKDSLLCKGCRMLKSTPYKTNIFLNGRLFLKFNFNMQIFIHMMKIGVKCFEIRLLLFEFSVNMESFIII